MTAKSLLAATGLLFCAFDFAALALRADEPVLKQEWPQLIVSPQEADRNGAAELVLQQRRAAISGLYGNRLIRGQEAWKVVGYARKALEHTSDLQERCGLYIDWASARESQIALGLVPKDGFREARCKAAVPYLHVLAIVAENLKITERQPPPRAPADVRESEPSENSPRLHEWAVWATKRIEEQRREWDLQDYLFVTKQPLIARLAVLYSTPPLATEELRRLATEIVKKPEMVKEIMDAVEAKIRGQEAEAKEKGEKAAAGAVPPKTEQAAPQP